MSPSRYVPLSCLVLLCILTTAIAAQQEGSHTTNDAKVLPKTPSLNATSRVPKVEEWEALFEKKESMRYVNYFPWLPVPTPQPPAAVALIHETIAPEPNPPLNDPAYAITEYEWFEMRMESLNYRGPSNNGVSIEWMRKMFYDNLHGNVATHMQKGTGGAIEEFGPLPPNPLTSATCSKEPTLTLRDVKKLAKKSFGIRNFKVSYPPCDGSARKSTCKFGGGRQCCTRPQTEFIGRYYDTAVAAMALGATRDEAFAVLMHARSLAHNLRACDNDHNFEGYFPHNVFTYQIRDEATGQVRDEVYPWAKLSMISFPVAYEVLYELYNTMLIERIRSRGAVTIPTDAQMRVLSDRLYYKKLTMRLTHLNRDLDPEFLFPSAADFTAAGLTMATSSRMGRVERMANSTANFAKIHADSELHPSLRASLDRITVYETSTRGWHHMDDNNCNSLKYGHPYFPYKFQVKVWNRYEGCCAQECTFMAHYGKTFSVGSANCCSGCNRYRCTVNGFNVAKFLATVSTIEAPNKINVGAEEMTLIV